MYFQEEQEYMSEPIDDISESSYIKINKRFLEELKQTNKIDDLSIYREESDEEDSKFLKPQNKSGTVNGQNFLGHHKLYDNSPIKSNFYKDIVGDTNEEEQRNNTNKKSKLQKNKDFKNQTPQKNQSFMKLSQKISKLSHFEKKETCTPEENTFQYYLLRKSLERKQKESQILRGELNSYNEINEMQTKAIFSPKNQMSTSNRVQNQQKIQIERINYKKLLENEISKNKQLETQIYNLESKMAHLNLQYQESTKSAKKLEKELTNANKVRKENKNRMKELDLKLEGFKSVCRIKNTQKDQLVIEMKKENKILKEENQKYRIFTETLAESIFVLKGKKPKNMEDIWLEWKDIFESFSKNKWSLSKVKSPNKRA